MFKVYFKVFVQEKTSNYNNKLAKYKQELKVCFMCKVVRMKLYCLDQLDQR